MVHLPYRPPAIYYCSSKRLVHTAPESYAGQVPSVASPLYHGVMAPYRVYGAVAGAEPVGVGNHGYDTKDVYEKGVSDTERALLQGLRALERGWAEVAR
jgi:hypothetical protein